MKNIDEKILMAEEEIYYKQRVKQIRICTQDGLD